MIQRKNWYLMVLMVYAAGYLLFPPRVLVINDEERYVVQAMAFARGAMTLPAASPLLPPTTQRVASDFPPGTSLLQSVLVRVGGWRAAGLASVLGLCALTFFTARLLQHQAFPQEFALVVPAFAATLFFGRVAMSDVPTAALVALAVWLIVRCDKDEWRRSLYAGLASGATLLFREPTALLLAPFILGAIARRKCVVSALLLGGTIAVAARLAISQSMFGDPFYVRSSGYGFSLEGAAANLPLYALVLLVMFPLGAVLPFFYRGPRRAETVTAFALYALLFVFYEYSPWQENGVAKGTVLGARFMIPLLPLLAVMSAEVATRWKSRTVATTRAVSIAGLVALVAGAFAIHPLFRRLEAEPYGIVSALREHTSTERPVIMNAKAAGKYLSPVYGARRLIWRSAATVELLRPICRAHGGLQLVILDRSDSEMFREDATQNSQFIAAMERHFLITPVYDRALGASFRLRVLDVSGCSAGAGG